MLKQARVIISGDVQMVGYRSWCKKNALGLGLTGWARNREDGCVEAVFQGNEEKVKEMIERCKKGPEVCMVEDVRVEWRKATGEFDDFEIKR